MAKRDGKATALPKPVPISDLHLACFLLSLDFSLLRIEGSSSRALFIFADVPEQTILAFYREDSSVNPRKLLDSLRNLKGLLLQQDRGRR